MTDELDEKTIKRRLGNFKRAWKNASEETKDKVRAMAVLKTYEKYYDRWCEMCGIEEPDLEAFRKEPHVRIEMLLCDLNNIRALRSGDPEKKQAVYDLMDDEMKQIYFYELSDTGSGARYCDIEDKKKIKEQKRWMKNNRQR